MRATGAVLLPQQATPAAPAAGLTALYSKSDGGLYIRANGGVETAVQDFTWVTLAADATNTLGSATPTTVALGFTPAVGTYLVEWVLAVTSAATTTGAQIGVLFPTATMAAYRIETPTTATADAQVNASASGTMNATTAGLTTATITNIQALLTFGVAGASAVGLRLQTEVATSVVTIKAGSICRYRKVA